MANLSTVSDAKQRKYLTRYRLNHSLAIKRGRHRQTWLPREERLCIHCSQGRVETHTHTHTHTHTPRTTHTHKNTDECDPSLNKSLFSVTEYHISFVLTMSVVPS